MATNGLCFSKEKAGSSGRKEVSAKSSVSGKMTGQDAMSLFDGMLRTKVNLLLKVIYRFPDDDKMDGDDASIEKWYSELKKETTRELGTSGLLTREQCMSLLVRAIAKELPDEGKAVALLELIALMVRPRIEERQEGWEKLLASNEVLKKNHGIDGFNSDEFYRRLDDGDISPEADIAYQRFRLEGQCWQMPHDHLWIAVEKAIELLLDAPGATTSDLESALVIYTCNCSQNLDDEYGWTMTSHRLFGAMMREIAESPNWSARLGNIGMLNECSRDEALIWGNIDCGVDSE
jgi:hypothetical protein